MVDQLSWLGDGHNTTNGAGCNDVYLVVVVVVGVGVSVGIGGLDRIAGFEVLTSDGPRCGLVVRRRRLLAIGDGDWDWAGMSFG